MIFSLSSRIVEAAESNVSGPASNEHSMLWMNKLRLVFHRHRNSTHQSPNTTHHSPYTVCHASGKTLLYESGKKVCSWPPHALEQVGDCSVGDCVGRRGQRWGRAAAGIPGVTVYLHLTKSPFPLTLRQVFIYLCIHIFNCTCNHCIIFQKF